jgi:hypothetical protein
MIHWKPEEPQRELPIGAEASRLWIIGPALIFWLVFWTFVAAIGGF